MAIIEELSGIILNQNVPPTDGTNFYTATGAKFYQEFFVPDNFLRGTADDEQRFPSLTGFQMAVGIDQGFESAAAFDWTLEYRVFELDWIKVDSGTAIGAHTYGNRVWMNALFTNPIPFDLVRSNSRFRIGIVSNNTATGTTINQQVDYDGKRVVVNGNIVNVQLAPDKPYAFTLGGVKGILIYKSSEKAAFYSAQQGPTKFWYSAPNPLSTTTAVARAADGLTALIRPGDSAQFSFMFRVLALTADDGIDFLGNSYRSLVVEQSADNTSALDNNVADKYWLSKPNPSRFAIESLYFDLRPIPSNHYGVTNLISNPSFEVDATGWATTGSTATITTFARATDWQWSGHGSLKLSGSMAGVQVAELRSPTFAVRQGEPISASMVVDILNAFNGTNQGTLAVQFDDGSNTFSLGTSSGAAIAGTGVQTATVTNAIAPSSTTQARLRFQGNSSGGGDTFDIRIDSVIATKTSTQIAYFDGDFNNHIWTGQPHGSSSVEIISATPSDTESVVDRILLDPLTPGMYFSVYYTSEGGKPTSEDEWDQKLWKVVPKTFYATKREVHVLPQPIAAKFIKVEFSHLQAKHYSPGDFARPITYKKHPKWVLDYFLARLDQQQAIENRLGIQRVGIVYDALDIAYNYYLDDLGQEPTLPIEIQTSEATKKFLGRLDDKSDQVDSSVLSQINLSLEPYRNNPTSFAKNGYLPGYVAKSLTPDQYPVEGGRVPGTSEFADIQSLRNRTVAFEQDFPVMNFYLTCRHGYRLVTAEFSHDRAYFAGVNEIAFTRENYTVAHDNTQYIEPGGDLNNIERNDFISLDGSLLVSTTLDGAAINLSEEFNSLTGEFL